LKETDRMHGRFCKEILRMSRCAANRVAELELEDNRRGGKKKYYIQILVVLVTHEC
jgi:hypothetical protein